MLFTSFILFFTAAQLEKDCAVCKEQFTIDAEDTADLVVVTLPCKHPFHEGCIVPWIKASGTCPVCRLVFPYVARASYAKLTSPTRCMTDTHWFLNRNTTRQGPRHPAEVAQGALPPAHERPRPRPRPRQHPADPPHGHLADLEVDTETQGAAVVAGGSSPACSAAWVAFLPAHATVLAATPLSLGGDAPRTTAYSISQEAGATVRIKLEQGSAPPEEVGGHSYLIVNFRTLVLNRC